MSISNERLDEILEDSVDGTNDVLPEMYYMSLELKQFRAERERDTPPSQDWIVDAAEEIATDEEFAIISVDKAHDAANIIARCYKKHQSELAEQHEVMAAWICAIDASAVELGLAACEESDFHIWLTEAADRHHVRQKGQRNES